MNDYYRGYRPGNNRFDRNYRGYNSHISKGHDTINGNKKTENDDPVASSEPMSKLFAEFLPTMKTFLTHYGEIQKRMADITELSLMTEKIKVKALLTIARALKQILALEENTNEQDETDSFTLMENELGEVLAALETSGAGLAVRAKKVDDGELIIDEDESGEINGGKNEPHTAHSNTDTKKMLILKIVALREEGLHFEQIAEHFTSAGIPTLSGKGKWHASTVSNLLKREIQA